MTNRSLRQMSRIVIGFVANKFYHKYSRPHRFLHSLYTTLIMPSLRQILTLLCGQSMAIGVTSTSLEIDNEANGVHQYLAGRDTTMWMSDVIIAPETTTTIIISTASVSVGPSTQSSTCTRHWNTIVTDFTTVFGSTSTPSSTTSSTSAFSIVPSTTTLTIDIAPTPFTSSSSSTSSVIYATTTTVTVVTTVFPSTSSLYLSSSSTIYTHIFPDLSVPISASIVPSATPFPIDLSFQLLDSDAVIPGTNGNYSFGCTNCTVSGSMNLTDENFTLNPSQLHSPKGIVQSGIISLLLSEGFQAHMEIYANISGQQSIDVQLIDPPIQGFNIRGIGTAGITFHPTIEVNSNLTNPVNFTTGFHLEIPCNSTINIDLGQPENSWGRLFEAANLVAFPLVMSGSPEGTLDIKFKPQMPIGFDFMNGTALLHLSIFMDMPSLELNIAKFNESHPGCLLDTNNQTTVYSTDLGFNVGFEILGSTNLTNMAPQPGIDGLDTFWNTDNNEEITSWGTEMILFSSRRHFARHCVPDNAAITQPILATSPDINPSMSAAMSSPGAVVTTYAPVGPFLPSIFPKLNHSTNNARSSTTNTYVLGLVVLALLFVMLM